MNKKEIYLDSASSTQIDKNVQKILIRELEESFANPNSKHKKGLECKIKIDNSKKIISQIINSKPTEIIFTSGATESNNIAILGIAEECKNKGNHIITTKTEHPSVLETIKHLEKNGFIVDYIKTNKEGIIDVEELKKKINKKTIFISIIFTNNITGTIQPIKEIGEICKKNNIIFHTDASQSILYESINIKELNCDLLTISSSKIHGPKGVSALYINDKIKLKNINFGGGQEKNLKNGTQNTPLIVAFAKALEISNIEKSKNYKKINNLKNLLISEIVKINEIEINGNYKKTSPHIINISFKTKNSNKILLKLDEENIFISQSSACKNGENIEAETLKEMGIKTEKNINSIRISLSKFNTKNEIKTFIESLKIALGNTTN